MDSDFIPAGWLARQDTWSLVEQLSDAHQRIAELEALSQEPDHG